MQTPKKQPNTDPRLCAIGQSQFDVWESSDVVVRIRRPDGKETWLRVPAEHWERVLALADAEFGETIERV